ncbi:MAG: hypothetical protein H0W86_00810 [Armatimonadetes bacterium]|nr:hypothetical protein [Armatimonadota bacterium]
MDNYYHQGMNDMLKKTRLTGLLGTTAAIAGLGAVAVYVVKLIREHGEEVDTAIDGLLDFYASKAAELDRIVSDQLVAN